MSSLPEVIDVRDDIEVAREESVAGSDARIAIAEAIERLEELERAESGERGGLLDDVENRLLRAEEQLGGDAERRLRSARNRIEQYRESLSRAGEGLAILDARLRRIETDDDSDRDVSPVEAGSEADERVETTVTVVNEGEPRSVAALVTFRDDAGEPISERRSDTIEFGADEQRSIQFETDRPAAAESHVATAVSADDVPALREER